MSATLVQARAVSSQTKPPATSPAWRIRLGASRKEALTAFDAGHRRRLKPDEAKALGDLLAWQKAPSTACSSCGACVGAMPARFVLAISRDRAGMLGLCDGCASTPGARVK